MPAEEFGCGELSIPAQEVVEVVDGVFLDGENLLGTTTRLWEIVSAGSNGGVGRLVVRCGLTTRLIALLQRHEHPKLQLQAARILTKIPTLFNSANLASLRMVPIFITLLSCNNHELRAQAVLALQHITRNSSQFRDQALDHGALVPLVCLAGEAKSPEMLWEIVSMISRWCRREPTPDFDVVCPVLPSLAVFLRSENTSIVASVGWALVALTKRVQKDHVDLLIRAQILSRAVELMSHPMIGIQVPAIRIMRNLASSSQLHIQAVIDCGALSPLRNIGKHSILVVEACSVILGMCEGTKCQIQSLVDSGVVEDLVWLVCNHSETDIKNHSLHVLNVLLEKAGEQVQHLLGTEFVTTLCDLFFTGGGGRRTQQAALVGIHNLLKLNANTANGGQNQTAVVIAEYAEFESWEEQLQVHDAEVHGLFRAVFELCGVNVATTPKLSANNPKSGDSF